MSKKYTGGKNNLSSNNNSVLIIFIFILSSALVFIWGFASSQFRFFPYNLVANSLEQSQEYDDKDYQADLLWAEKIREGGFFLHFRHAQREKWNDVVTFDALEVIDELRTEEESFARAVCLTPQGFEEALAIGRVLELAGVRVAQVWSSPSCRARQTAMQAFGYISQTDTSLLHRSAIPKKQWAYFDNQLRSLIFSLPAAAQANHVLVGHGGTLGNPGSQIIDKNDYGANVDDRDETGFVVLQLEGESLVAKHVFKSLRHFSQVALELPTN